MVSGSRGFTLIELLVVIAIVLILILIALPNFLEVQVRAGVVRVQGELRSISFCLGSYFLDFGFYPLRTLNQSLPPETPSGLNNLTTPVEYMNPARLEDRFPELPFFTHYRYWPIRPNGKVQDNDETAHNKDSNWYLLSSNGPERNFTPFAERMRGEVPEPFLDSIYSPTNGANSEGNIWRLGGAPDGLAKPFVAPYVISG
jgi:prepilin-type N-terminal cleavage/methylation domain-containing protein